MKELSPEQIAALKTAIDEGAQQQLNKFDRELDVVVDKLSTVGWTLPAELGIYTVKQFEYAWPETKWSVIRCCLLISC